MIRARSLGLPLVAVLAAGLLVAPALALMILTSRTVGDQLVERAALERSQTVAVVGRLMELTLANAGNDITTRGQSVKASLASGDRAALRAALSELRAVSPLYTNVAAFDASGTMLARDPDPGGLVGLNFAARDYYTGAMASDRPVVSEAFRSLAAPFGPLVAVSFALREGAITHGLLNITLSPPDVLRAFEPVLAVPGRDVIITDRHDRVIASSDVAHVPLSVADFASLYDRRFFAAAAIGSAGWYLYVVDPPAAVLAVQSDLDRDLRAGGIATGLAALVLGALLASLYGKVVRQRDALTESQAVLMRVNVELAAADRAKSTFLSDMSHELRTPMNAILGFSDLLVEQLTPTLSDRQKRFFSNIHVAGEHLLRLIDDVLDLSKVEAGRIELRPEVLELEVLLGPAVAAAKADAERAGLVFEYAGSPSGLVRLDPARTRQILFNLLSNAVKFTEPAGTVTAEVVLDGDRLVLSVSDTGIGIPADAQALLFGVFERVNRDRSDAQGTGLGLALTKRLVELQGGTISFESEEGEGSRFTVVFPDARYSVIRSEAILIVEDDWADAELLDALAVETGLATHHVSTLAEAVAALRHARPLAVVLDLFLPDGHGSSILEMLKSSAETVDVPILVVTSAIDTARFRLMGAECMTKPIDPIRVRAWLRRVAPPIAA